MDTRDVPHGAVAEVYYPSTVLGRARRMHVYTPPGYQSGGGRYPVFYLLHGAGDSDDSWSTVGRAGFILDNLIASGRAEPMIVVMPAGHTGTSGGAANEFEREFAADIKPYVEENYRVQTSRARTAIAGLSMGGAQTLEIAFSDLDEYGYVGVFSSGVFDVRESSDWEKGHEAALSDASLRRGLELVWFSTGRDDRLLDVTKATVGLLEKHGFDVTFEESTGGHTWINWREYLNEFAPMLFR
jgi:enterochelin esterase family protein